MTTEETYPKNLANKFKVEPTENVLQMYTLFSSGPVTHSSPTVAQPPSHPKEDELF